MKEEKERKNGCKIFCIFFKSEYGSYGKDSLKKIAKLGQTEDIYNPTSLESLCNVFYKIADIIQTNYQLKLNKIINN